ncbi:hypothetical protein PRIPAC_86783 [Pristionchus pacificus]|uniref:Transmembrane ion channel n=1 Tax=Pristionchus pacificus TaxID=54126 RepID=A0A2A6BN35_PRIPA|nr:hypothetical protein PRIPAC_86783 [Pristionchus pacificus]|eukprot:PDM67203.1 transmembrane ion channel [Pristionchus pacificus]
MLFLSPLLLFLLPSSVARVKSKRQVLTEKLFNGYDYKKSPDGMTKVFMKFGVQHVHFPSDDSPLAVMICTVIYTWQDKRLIWNPLDYDGIRKLILPANHKLWKPQLMTNMDGKNHQVASTAHLLKGFELEVKDGRRESIAQISMYRRVELELVCENESTFPTILKCYFHGFSKDDIKDEQWTVVTGGKATGFMDDNATGTGMFEIESVHGASSGNMYNQGMENNELVVVVRLTAKRSLHWILSTSFLSILSVLLLIIISLPPNHKYLHSFTLTFIYLMILIPSQLIFSIKSYSSFAVPTQTRVYAILFILSTLIIPIQNLFGSEFAKEKSIFILSLAQNVPYFKNLHSIMHPYTKDYELPFIFIFLKTIIVASIAMLNLILLLLIFYTIVEAAPFWPPYPPPFYYDYPWFPWGKK